MTTPVVTPKPPAVQPAPQPKPPMKEARIIAIVGESGKGKTTSLRNLNRERTKFFNVENKPLPFIGEFTDVEKPPNIHVLLDRVKIAAMSPKYDMIVVDSMSEIMKLQKMANEASYTGFDIYKYLNNAVTNFLVECKKLPKTIVLFFHGESINDTTDDGKLFTSRRIHTYGKELEGKLEREFAIVLWCVTKSTKNPEAPVSYHFLTNSDGIRSAKSPMGLFPLFVDNDLAAIMPTLDLFFQGIHKPLEVTKKQN